MRKRIMKVREPCKKKREYNEFGTKGVGRSHLNQYFEFDFIDPFWWYRGVTIKISKKCPKTYMDADGAYLKKIIFNT